MKTTKETTVLSCKIDGCDGKGQTTKKGIKYFTKGYCHKHYLRFLKHGDANYSIGEEWRHLANCRADGCNSVGYLDSRTNKRYLRMGYCGKHYARLYKYGDYDTIKSVRGHSFSKDNRYKVYYGIKARCDNPTNNSYKHYGERGIKICDRWLGVYGFLNFIEDMGERPDGTSIDRIDNDGDYTPDNCRWATINQQACNRRNNNKDVGVSKIIGSSGYRAYLKVDGAFVLHKRFENYDDAVAARAKAVADITAEDFERTT